MSRAKIGWGRRLACGTFLVSMLLFLVGAAPALANDSWWSLSSSSWPTTLPTGGEGTVVALAQNLGYAPIESGTLEISDRLPTGVVPQSVSFYIFPYENGKVRLPESLCHISGQEVTCQLSESNMHEFPLAPYDYLEMRIAVKVEGAASRAKNDVSVLGSAAPSASIARPLTVGSSTQPF